MQKSIQRIVIPLVEWYQENKRDLPWRRDTQPYHVWVSEVMLQQTRIEAVIGYYTRFMQELPTIEDLSHISEEKLLKLWEGLGYYSRAKNLKKAAEIIMQKYHGEMPQTFVELKSLPGIGDYTAGAIASICFQEKVTAVDGNVLRVVSRVLGSTKNVLLPETKKEMDVMLKAVMPKNAGEFNESLMELGEIVCLPNGAPLCEKCPVREQCSAFREQKTAVIPVREKELKRKKEEKTVFVLISPNNKIAIEKREARGLLGGMYQLPNEEGVLTEKEMKKVLQNWQLKEPKIWETKEAKHVFTHIDWQMKGYYCTVANENDDFLWATSEELVEQYPLPTAFQKFLKYLPEIKWK